VAINFFRAFKGNFKRVNVENMKSDNQRETQNIENYQKKGNFPLHYIFLLTIGWEW
jgi:hypothetical protein